MLKMVILWDLQLKMVMSWDLHVENGDVMGFGHVCHGD